MDIDAQPTYTPKQATPSHSNWNTGGIFRRTPMRKTLVAVAALIGTACVNKAGSPAADRPVPIAAATQAAPAKPAETPHVEQKAHPSMRVEANTKKTSTKVKVAKTARQESTQQKSPVSEGIRKEGPG
jgi:hypothetical protein